MDNPFASIGPGDSSSQTSSTFGRDAVVDEPLQNLINEAAKKNQILSQTQTQNLSREKQQNKLVDLKLDQIHQILKDGGMDSMSAAKALAKIKALLS